MNEGDRKEMQLNWKPLEEKLGRKRCAGFMFKGQINGINLKCEASHFKCEAGSNVELASPIRMNSGCESLELHILW
jgi:hypothetical protein